MARTKQNNKKVKETKNAETRVAETKVDEKAEAKPKTQEEIIQQLVSKVRENLTVADSKYVQVNENFKKVGPGLSLSGLGRLYKQADKANFVLVPEFKIAGPLSVVETLLSSLSSSLSQQRAKEYGVLDLNNYETYISTHVAPVEPAPILAAITSDKIAEIAQLIKTKKTKKEERDTPKKKKAQRRKSPTGVELAKSPRIGVDPLTGLTLDGLLDLLKKLAKKQEGLDVSKTSVSQEGDVLTVTGAKTFKIKAGSKSKRVLLEGSLRGLASETPEAVGTLLQELGLSAAEQKVHLDKFKSGKSTGAAGKKEEVKAKQKKAGVKKDRKEKEKEKEKEKPAETTKAKTRDVKPRTSKD